MPPIFRELELRFIETHYKSRSTFIKFDICDFYPSISEELLDRALDFAKLHTDISNREIDIIKHARKSLLFSQSTEWIKNNLNNDLFDVKMSSYDWAEVCELVGLYLFSKLQRLLDSKSVGLYRDDGLACLKSLSGRRLDRLRKDIIEVFKSENLSIRIEINLRITDFLDVTLDLSTGKYSPFRKPNTKPLYIHSKSPNNNYKGTSQHVTYVLQKRWLSQDVGTLACWTNEQSWSRSVATETNSYWWTSKAR